MGEKHKPRKGGAYARYFKDKERRAENTRSRTEPLDKLKPLIEAEAAKIRARWAEPEETQPTEEPAEETINEATEPTEQPLSTSRPKDAEYPKDPAHKYYKKWGMPRRYWFSRHEWSFVDTMEKEEKLHLPPREWNKVLHEILYSELNQRDIGRKLGIKAKYVRAVFAEIRDRVPVLEQFMHLGEAQKEVLLLKMSKRKWNQAQIHKYLKKSRARISVIFKELETIFRRNDRFSPSDKEGVNTYFERE